MTTIEFNSARLLSLTKWCCSPRNLSRVAWYQVRDEACSLWNIFTILLMTDWSLTNMSSSKKQLWSSLATLESRLYFPFELFWLFSHLMIYLWSYRALILLEYFALMGGKENIVGKIATEICSVVGWHHLRSHLSSVSAACPDLRRQDIKIVVQRSSSALAMSHHCIGLSQDY